MFEGNDKLEVNEVKGCKKVLPCGVDFDLYCVLLPECMKDSDSVDICSSFSILDGSFEGLDLKFLGSCGWYFNVIVFVEKKGYVVVGSSFHFFPSILFDYLLFDRIEVNSIS